MPLFLGVALENPSPSLVWLASGMPSPEKFPFRKMTVTLEGGKELTLSQEALSTGLQYGPSQGSVKLSCDIFNNQYHFLTEVHIQ